MRKRNVVLALVLSLGCVAGCMSAEDKGVVSTGASVGQGNLREWDKLSDDQKKTAHTNLVAGYCVLDNHINGTALPAWVAALISQAQAAKKGN